MKHTIRRALPSQAEDLSRVAHEAKASWGYPAEWMAAWREELTITPEYVANQQVFVAETGGCIAGLVALETGEGGATLEHVWVATTRRGEGVGAALVRYALDAAKRAGHEVVRVTSDPNAVGFYLRFGARVAGSLPAPMPGAPQRVLPLLELPVGDSSRCRTRGDV